MSKDELVKEGILASVGNIAIVLNQNTHPLELDILANSAPAHIAVRIATHPRALKRTLARLAECKTSDVRCAVGENSNTPEETLWKLAFDNDPDVRYSLAENHNLKKDILHALTSDDNPYVAVRAQRTLERLAAVVAETAHRACHHESQHAPPHEVHQPVHKPSAPARLNQASSCA